MFVVLVGAAIASCLGMRSRAARRAATPSAPPPPALIDVEIVPPADAAPVPGDRRVLLVSIDGLRPDAIAAHMPRLSALAAQGMRAKTAATIALTDTLPSHASMISGVDSDVHGLTWNAYDADRPTIGVPTMFSVAHDHGYATAMFVGKPKLRHLRGAGVDHFELPVEATCTGVVAAVLARELAALTLVHFSNPDDAGHHHGWMTTAYLAALRATDACLGALLDGLAPHAARMLVIVTADHGGSGRGHGHGGDDPEVRTIPWIARGPGIAAGTTIDAPVTTLDTPATILDFLALPALGRGVSRLP